MPQDVTFRRELDNLIEKIRAYLPDANFQRIRKAFSFAQEAHEGQMRRSGESYLIHPIKTAEILADFHVDEDTIISALLHDVPEDTSATIADIERGFGKKIAYLVDGITKLSKVHYRNDMEERQIESLKKLFIHSAEDLRVILIKLADRLHNMRTLQFIAEEKKRVRIARETLEIYVPIANLLGISEMRVDLEDLCFQYLWPIEASKLKQQLEETTEERNFILDEMIHLTERELKKNKIDAEIIGRQKTLYSTFRKLQVKKSLANIDDLIAIRVIVPTRKDCYVVLGIIHKLFKPKPITFRDYIAVPKPNGYQSIHTSVFGINSSILEYQIRTRYMHLEAEYGIAAHYFYKYSSELELAQIMRQRSSWVQRILDIQKDHDNKNFLQNLKLDIFQDRIFTFSPKGDVTDLPRGATALDFAYAIHTDVGNHAVKAEINGTEFPCTTVLATGDTVRIITAKHQKPEREWLNYVRTNLAYNRIRAWLKKLPYEEKLLMGKRFLQREFNYLGKNFVDELTTKRIKLLAQNLPVKTLEDLLVAVGEGVIQPKEILSILYEENLFEKPRFLKRANMEQEVKVKIRIIGNNQNGLFREVLRQINSLKIPMLQFKIDKPWYAQEDRLTLTLLVKNYDELSQVFEGLENIAGITKISRLFFGRKLLFGIFSLFTVATWIAHPIIIQIIQRVSATGTTQEPQRSLTLTSSVLLYGGLFMLFGLIFYLRKITSRSFPELGETKYFWPVVFALITFALFTLIGEIMFFELTFNWVNVLGLILVVYAIFIVEFLRYRHEQIS